MGIHLRKSFPLVLTSGPLHFSYWQGDVPYGQVHNDTIQLLMDQDRIIKPVFSVQSENKGWVTYMHDVQHSGRSPVIAAQSNDIKWTYTSDETVLITHFGDPLVGKDGTIYMSEYKGNSGYQSVIKAIDYRDGSIIITSPELNGMPTSFSVADDLKIFSGTEKGWLYCLDKNDLGIDWGFPLGDVIKFVSYDEEYLNITNEDAKFYRLDLNGNIIWEYDFGTCSGCWAVANSSPAIDSSGCVLVVRPTGYFGTSVLFSLDPTDELEIFQVSTNGSQSASVTISEDNSIYLAAPKLCKFSSLGDLFWFRDLSELCGTLEGTPGELRCTPVALSSTGNSIIACANSSQYGWAVVKCFNSSGDIVWKYCLEQTDMPVGMAIGGDDSIYILIEERILGSNSKVRVECLDSNGDLKWFYKFNEEALARIGGPAIGIDGSLYITIFNKLYAFGD